MAEVNIWAWWQNALAGSIGPIHDGDPQQGYYRTRFKDKPWEPVAIWFEDGKWYAMRGDHQIDASDIWTWCCRNPITYEAYTKAIEGGGWDDEPEAPSIGHNLPSDPFEALQVEFEAEKEQVDAFLKNPIKTKDQADRAAVWTKRLSTIAKKATDLHKVEKQPHLDAGRVVDDKWRGLKEDPAELSKKLKRHMDEYLREQQRIEMERQRKAQEEADRKRREAEEAARAAAKADNEAAAAEAKRLQDEADQADRDAQARNASAGRTGAKVALRTFVSARITNYDKLVGALKDRPEVREVVETLANRAARSGVELEGMEIASEQRAA
ncbi:hypothetical protein [Rhizobium favelukesii]|uniref:hypothetical protein n=1 Tax=Rhizobium favelukesii TaxID=348824 RepID=UPI00215E28E3|nr:hypothetical protein [Rhizobium favelukesii]MCS0459497.1 hypothetical protein [Rhizobium favelukesii]